MDYEKLGVFYLGREYDAKKNALKDDLILYDSKDLTTHAVCVGMTGSGKTGLCLALLEEAAIDGVPAICIDPKGDIANLLLTFPNLAAQDFAPWVDRAEAQRKGLTVDAYAAQTADTWKKGLAEWNEPPARIAKFRDSADIAIYTPGAETGLPLSVLRSFAPPAPELLADSTALRDRVSAVVSGLLNLLGRDADPVQSREHILLANVLERSWREGVNLDMTALIAAVQRPPMDKVGAFDLETFFHAARDGDQQPARLARLRHLDDRRTARRAAPAVHSRRQAAHLDHLDRAPFRSRAHVHRDAGAERVDRLDARAIGHSVAARDFLHGRNLRLFPAERESAVKDPDADAAQARSRVRPRLRSRHAEPGRSGL
jgi:hypothetical protein